MEFNAPVKRTSASFNHFMGKLVVIVPHEVVKSTFPKTSSKGVTYFPDQTIAHLIPVELTEGTIVQGKDAGKAFRYEAGEPVLTYIGVSSLKNYLTQAITIRWRNWLTDKLQELYILDNNYVIT